jgi:hypothetical protein
MFKSINNCVFISLPRDLDFLTELDLFLHTSQETHYILDTEFSLLMLCKVWGFHGRDWRMLSSEMRCRVALERTDVSEERIASIIRVTRICELWTTLAVLKPKHGARLRDFAISQLQGKMFPVGSVPRSPSNETVIYDYGSFATLTKWVMCTAKYRPVLLSEREPYMKKDVHVRLKYMWNLVKGPKGRPDTKTYWRTDGWSQIQLHSIPLQPV